MTLAGALVLSLLSAAALNWGYLAQHGAARDLPPLTLRAPIRSLRSLFGDLSWLAGFVVGILGWVFYLAALALAPLSLVQGVSAGGIGVLAALARRRGDPVTRFHSRAIVAAMLGLALLAISLAGGTTNAHAAKPIDVNGIPTARSASAPAIIVQKVTGSSFRSPPIARMSCS